MTWIDDSTKTANSDEAFTSGDFAEEGVDLNGRR